MRSYDGRIAELLSALSLLLNPTRYQVHMLLNVLDKTANPRQQPFAEFPPNQIPPSAPTTRSAVEEVEFSWSPSPPQFKWGTQLPDLAWQFVDLFLIHPLFTTGH